MGQAQNQRFNAYSLFKLAWNSYSRICIVMHRHTSTSNKSRDLAKLSALFY